MGELTVHRIQHVSLTRPVGSEQEARAFYGDVLGLQEVAPPHALSHLDLVWFKIGDDELHLLAEPDPSNTGSGRHYCIAVEDLAAFRQRLETRGYRPEDVVAIPGRPRFFCRDPFGNNIEFTTIEGSYD